MTARRRVDAATPLPACPETRIGLSMPSLISDRLDDLVALAEEVGEHTNRKELLASLILAAPTAGADVSTLVRSYRLAKARDALLGGNDDQFIAIRSHRPGPRPRGRP